MAVLLEFSYFQVILDVSSFILNDLLMLETWHFILAPPFVRLDGQTAEGRGK